MSGDLYYDNVVLLLHCDGADGSTTFTDNSPTPKTVTAYGNAHIETDPSAFGGTSGDFDGASDGLMLADVALGTDDCTIEMFIQTSASVQYAQLIGNEGAGGFTLLMNWSSPTNGELAFYINGGLIFVTTSGDWSDGARHHIAVVRSGTGFTIYTDGSANGTGTSSASLSGSDVWVGRNNVYAPRNLVGKIEEVRISTVARYTANFTPPTEAFPNFSTKTAALSLAAFAPAFPIQPGTALFGLQAFGLACAPLYPPSAELGYATYAPLLEGILLPAAIEFRHAPLIPWIMPMTSPVYPPGVTVTMTNPTPGVSIRGLWSPHDMLFGWDYDDGTDKISIPLATLFELTSAQADAVTGDWRAVILALVNTMWDAYIELDDPPKAISLEYSPGYVMNSGPLTGAVKVEYTAVTYLTFPEKYIAGEP